MSSQLNHKPFKKSVKGTATFTVDGDTRPLTKFLVRNSYWPADLWRDHKPVYHIEVQTTTGGLQSKFSISSAKVVLVNFPNSC